MELSTAITLQEVKRIAALSRLGLSESELQAATKNLAGVLDHFSVIQKVDTSAVPEAINLSGVHNVTRPDTAESDILCAADDLLANAPHVAGRHIRVKAVFPDETL